MARVKKSRKGGSIGIAKAPKESSGSRKRKPVSPPKNRQKTGNAAGSRHNVEANGDKSLSNSASKDKRVGSKKPIQLIVEKAQKSGAMMVKKNKFATPAEELAVLEADDRFNRLLDDIEDEQTLSKDDQIWINQQLARHKILCDLLGIKEQPEAIEDDPFSQLDAIQLDDFKD